MKKSIFLFSLLWLMLTLAACGKKEEPEDYYEIRVESRILDGVEDNQWLLGRQYDQGEPVSLIAEKVNAEDGTPLMDVYLQPAGKDRQLLISGVSRTYRSTQWYLDGEGNCFIPQTDGVIRLGRDGDMLYYSKTDGWVRDICGLESGRIILLLEENKIYGLAELDPVTGAVIRIDMSLGSGSQYIAASGDGLVLLDAEGFWQVDLKKGTKTLELPFGGSSYLLQEGEMAADFWAEGSKAGIIWTSGIEEQLDRVNISKEREVIRIRGQNFTNSLNARWLKKQVQLFNQSNDTYYVVLEDCGEGISAGDFCTETQMQLAAGKGADIICEDALPGDAYNMIVNGVFADLTPLMEASNVREDDYFPAAFSSWKHEGNIYGIGLGVYYYAYTMDQTLMDGRGELTMETFLDIMLESEVGSFVYELDANWILKYLLQGSEDLWGTVDWEEGTCDFSRELFSKMLQASKKCAYDKRQDTSDVDTLLESKYDLGFRVYETMSELAQRGQMMAGPLFEDGCHATVTTHGVMGINAKSKQVGGAWQFLAFLLGEEAQSDEDFGLSAFPVNRRSFDQAAQRYIEADLYEPVYDASGRQTGKKYNGRQIKGETPVEEHITQEIVDDMIRYMEDASFYPLRPQPLITIIVEEAADYFSGAKSEKEVIDVIQNRVQLYLNEQQKK